MTSAIGNFSLCAAVLAACLSVLFAVAGGRRGSDDMLRWARWCIGLIALFIAVSSAALVIAFLTNDFRFAPVAAYSERALPLGYKLAAFWAGQEGSLLLWALMLGGLCAGAAVHFRDWNGVRGAAMISTLAVICGFFAALLLFAANPFTLVPDIVPRDGRGLNPMLQNPGMILHPPLLFMGYAGFAVPFAAAIGVLVAGTTDNRWLAKIRKWMLFAWLFLTAGIVLGAWWAYVELGWGGYWAWDPVENASLMPWLTATALMHSMMVQQHRGMFKRWNVSLITVTFILCIFGTYITRSGVIQSVHSFAPSLIGTFFLVFLLLLLVGSIGLIAVRFRRLRPEHALDGLVSREGAFLLGNVMLVVMTLTTVVGTTYPLTSSIFQSESVTVNAAFYNKVVGPAAIIVVALMTLGPILVFGKTAASQIARSLIVPGSCAAIVTGVVFAFGIHSIWALVSVFLVVLGTLTVFSNFLTSIAARRRNTGEGVVASTIRLIDGNHRRYGGQFAHLGVMMLVIGVIGSSIYNDSTILQMRSGESATLGDYSVTLVALDQVSGPNYEALQATVALSNDRGEEIAVLQPQKRLYTKWQDDFNTEVALRSTVVEDVYAVLAGWEAGGEIVAIQLHFNPLVLWIWIGGIVMVIGSLFCILPRMLPRAARARVHEPEHSDGVVPTAGLDVATLSQTAINTEGSA